MRLGSIIYFIPFFFVLNPALILQGEAGAILRVLLTSVIGVVLLASALQGYLIGAGDLTRSRVGGWVVRVALIAAGLLFALPGGEFLPYNNLQMALAGTLLAVPAILLGRFLNRTARLKRATSVSAAE